MSASVNLPLHHKVQKFSSGTGSPGWSRKKGRKTVVVWWWHSLLELLPVNVMFLKSDRSLSAADSVRVLDGQNYHHHQ